MQRFPQLNLNPVPVPFTWVESAFRHPPLRFGGPGLRRSGLPFTDFDAPNLPGQAKQIIFQDFFSLLGLLGILFLPFCINVAFLPVLFWLALSHGLRFAGVASMQSSPSMLLAQLLKSAESEEVFMFHFYLRWSWGKGRVHRCDERCVMLCTVLVGDGTVCELVKSPRGQWDGDGRKKGGLRSAEMGRAE